MLGLSSGRFICLPLPVPYYNRITPRCVSSMVIESLAGRKKNPFIIDIILLSIRSSGFFLLDDFLTVFHIHVHVYTQSRPNLTL